MTELRVVLCTAPVDKAEELARAILERRLAACVNLVPQVRSLYWWEGAIQDEPETLLVLKTTADTVAALLAELPALHPYETPEIITLPVPEAHPPYRDWVSTCLIREST